MEEAQFPKGDTWSVHKFGGTCVGNSQRIKNVAHIIIKDPSERKLIVVSAMSKVTDMMYDLIDKAQSRDDSYVFAVDSVLEKHRSTALDLLEGNDLANFLSRLDADISNLKAMLRAIYIGKNTLSCRYFFVQAISTFQHCQVQLCSVAHVFIIIVYALSWESFYLVTCFSFSFVKLNAAYDLWID